MHLFLGTVCVRGGRLKAKWCRIMGPSVSAELEMIPRRKLVYFPFQFWFQVYPNCLVHSVQGPGIGP